MVENELQFLRRDEFRQMTPAILRLEVDRLGTLIDAAGEATEYRNALVKARYELRRFIACVEEAEPGSMEEEGAPHLEAALLATTFAPAPPDEHTAQMLAYVADRLRYVHDRLPLLY